MSLKQRLKSHVSTLVLGTLLVGVAAYEWKQVKTGQVISSAQAKTGPEAPQNVLAEGRVAVPPGAEITVGAELNGKLLRLLVKELDTVKAGDVLAEVDVKEQQAALNEAWARVKESGADVDFTARERRRSQQLWNSNVVAEATLLTYVACESRSTEAGVTAAETSPFRETVRLIGDRLAVPLE